MAGEALRPDFENAYWRREQRVLYRKHPAFSPKKRHFEPESHSSLAERFAEDLTLEESREEIRRVYENCVVILRAKRSRMERGDRSLVTDAFRYRILALQDPLDPASLLVSRQLHVNAPLNELPEHFDDLFPWKAEEIVVPFSGGGGRKELLETLEHWEEKLGGRIEESADQSVLTLRLGSGFALALHLRGRELAFAKRGVEGVRALAAAVAGDLKSLGLARSLA